MSFYHTTTAGSAADVVDKIITFCQAKTWNTWQDFDLGNRWVVKGTGEPIEIYAQNDYVYFRGVYAGTPNVSAEYSSYMRLYGHSIVEMHMFAYDSPDVIYLIFKLSDGTYRQGVLGECSKVGAWTGGTMCMLSNHQDANTFRAGMFPAGYTGNNRMFGGYNAFGGLFVNNGEGSGNWRPFYTGVITLGIYSVMGSGDNYAGKIRIANVNHYDQTYFLWNNSESNFNWSTHLVPFKFLVGRPDNLLSPAGYAPHFRVTKGAQLGANQTGTVGGDTWRFFPVLRRGDPTDAVPASYNFYYALFMDTGMETPIAV